MDSHLRAVATGHQAHAAGAAHRRGDEAVRQVRALVEDAVNIRRNKPLVSRSIHGIRRLVVGEDENDVGPGDRGSGKGQDANQT